MTGSWLLMSRAWPRVCNTVLLSVLLMSCSGPERASHCLGEPDLDIWQTSLDREVAPLVRAPGADGFARWSPDGTRFVFVGSRDGNCELYVANADGSDQINLTGSDDDEMHPSWSPDGSEIVFTAGGQLHVVTVATLERRQLTDSDRIHSFPDWSPDGVSIIFSGGEGVAGPGSVHQVYVVPASGGDETGLTNDDALLVAPRWSPDGEFIAYFEHGEPFTIWTMNGDGSGPSVLFDGGHFSWSPDGSSLVHDVATGAGDVDLYIDGELLVDGPGIDTLPSWSPDGTTIIFSSDRP
jgi:TolB protein